MAGSYQPRFQGSLPPAPWGESLSRSMGRVGENPGNEVGFLQGSPLKCCSFREGKSAAFAKIQFSCVSSNKLVLFKAQRATFNCLLFTSRVKLLRYLFVCVFVHASHSTGTPAGKPLHVLFHFFTPEWEATY